MAKHLDPKAQRRAVYGLLFTAGVLSVAALGMIVAPQADPGIQYDSAPRSVIDIPSLGSPSTFARPTIPTIGVLPSGPALPTPSELAEMTPAERTEAHTCRCNPREEPTPAPVPDPVQVEDPIAPDHGPAPVADPPVGLPPVVVEPSPPVVPVEPEPTPEPPVVTPTPEPEPAPPVCLDLLGIEIPCAPLGGILDGLLGSQP